MFLGKEYRNINSKQTKDKHKVRVKKFVTLKKFLRGIVFNSKYEI
jgi:hypothetical protein